MTNIQTKNEKRLSQGDILRDIEYIERYKEVEGTIEVTKIIYPMSIVLTQDCDLDLDYKYRTTKQENQDKILISILLAPLYNVEQVRKGKHLSELSLEMLKINSDRFGLIKTNQNARYHFLSFPEAIGLVDSIIDFKHYFSVSLPYLIELKQNQYVCSISPLFREEISQRFSYYLSRIPLPA